MEEDIICKECYSTRSRRKNPENEELNKNDSEYFYSLNFSNKVIKRGSMENPFYTKIKMGNKKTHKCLIDTGADVSIINKENVPQDDIFRKQKQRLDQYQTTNCKLSEK